MKVTVVPAQVTTVEDRIIGNLGFSQMMLLVVPIFFGAALFAILPPALGSSAYKYVIMGAIAIICCVLAIRIRGKILALWLVVILRYNLRPRYYIFNKNTTAQREQYPVVLDNTEAWSETEKSKNLLSVPQLDLPETVKVMAAIEDQAMQVRFEATKKGGLNVRLTEIED